MPSLRHTNTLSAALLFATALASTGCSDFRLFSSSASDGPALSPTQRQSADLTQQAQTALDAGNLTDALTLFNQALDADPQNFNANIGLGQALEQTGDLSAAAHSYEQAQAIKPDSFDANYKLAHVYHLLDRLADAVRAYLAALTINPDDPAANRDLAAAYLQLNQPQLALPYASRAVDLDPDDQPAFINLGAAHAALGNWESALAAYRRAVELGELTPPLANNLVNAHIQLGHFQQAAATLNSLIITDPRPEYFERLGYASFKLGNYNDSLDAYQQAADLDPTNTAALNGLGVSLMTRYIQTNRQYTHLRDRALDAWQRSVRVNGDQPRIIDLLTRYARL